LCNFVYYCFDGLGSVVALSDVNSDIVETYSYDVFGQPSAASSVANPYLFTGRRYDNETGLYYYRARYFDYYTGRFIQPDPIGYIGGLNLYTYVKNNPLRFTDPYGFLQMLIGPSVSAGTAGGGTGGIQFVIGPDVGFYVHGGGGGHAGVDYATTMDISIMSGRGSDLSGTSLAIGAAGQIPIIGTGLGLEANVGRNASGCHI
jgi:RHS repeat-associated protein